jgi:hypothetical protein|tara:strand:- start:670 stop:987 length:318 start_codon:yes stop_codon:yes gene_type:complete
LDTFTVNLSAIFESDILTMNISDEEFQKYNTFGNFIKILNDNNPQIFTASVAKAEGPLECLGAILGLAVAIVGLAACATIFLCWVSYVGFLLAVSAMSACNTNKK